MALSISSDNGTLCYISLTAGNDKPGLAEDTNGWVFKHASMDEATTDTFDWIWAEEYFLVRFPTVILAMLIGATAFVPWLYFRRRTRLVP
jgi:hypothetical protein